MTNKQNKNNAEKKVTNCKILIKLFTIVNLIKYKFLIIRSKIVADKTSGNGKESKLNPFVIYFARIVEKPFSLLEI